VGLFFSLVTTRGKTNTHMYINSETLHTGSILIKMLFQSLKLENQISVT
jgi:hypothetical protein